MKVSVVVAWRDTGEERRAAFSRVREFWTTRFPDAEFIASDCPHPDFGSYSACNRGIESASGELIVMADADVLPRPDLVREAITASSQAAGSVYPGTRLLYLRRRPTERLYKVGLDAYREETAAQDPATEMTVSGFCGGVLVYSKKTWQAVGGYDERFDAWGFGDLAFYIAARTLVAPERRFNGDILHLWHPRDPRSIPGHTKFHEAERLFLRYKAAVSDKRAVTELLDERKGS